MNLHWPRWIILSTFSLFTSAKLTDKANNARRLTAKLNSIIFNVDHWMFAGPLSSSIVESVLCYVSPTPWKCVKEQAARMLSQWEEVVEEKRHELMGECHWRRGDKSFTRTICDIADRNEKVAPGNFRRDSSDLLMVKNGWWWEETAEYLAAELIYGCD